MSHEHRKLSRFLGIGIACSAALATVSCSSQPGPTAIQPIRVSEAPTSAPTSQPISSHWIQDQRLRVLMTELKAHNPNWPAGLPQEPESPAATSKPYEFDEIAALANTLADTADHLPAVLDARPAMSQADRAGFLAEARTLHEQAVELQSAANRRNIENMQRQMDGINSTCVSCHSRYRDFSGVLNRTQAAVDFGATE